MKLSVSLNGCSDVMSICFHGHCFSSNETVEFAEDMVVLSLSNFVTSEPLVTKLFYKHQYKI